jgi:hypothetical protein
VVCAVLHPHVTVPRSKLRIGIKQFRVPIIMLNVFCRSLRWIFGRGSPCQEPKVNETLKHNQQGA